jgi:transposase
MVGNNEHPVAQWRRRFEAEGLAGLQDRQRSGRRLVYGHDQGLRIVATLTQEPPHPAGHRSHSQLAKALADLGISASQIGRILADLDIKPTGWAAGSPAPMPPASGSGPPIAVGSRWWRRPTRWC